MSYIYIYILKSFFFLILCGKDKMLVWNFFSITLWKSWSNDLGVRAKSQLLPFTRQLNLYKSRDTCDFMTVKITSDYWVIYFFYHMIEFNICQCDTMYLYIHKHHCISRGLLLYWQNGFCESLKYLRKKTISLVKLLKIIIHEPLLPNSIDQWIVIPIVLFVRLTLCLLDSMSNESILFWVPHFIFFIVLCIAYAHPLFACYLHLNP
jgi:hypothetical protein